MTSTREQLDMNRSTLEELATQHEGHEKRLEELKNKVWLTPEEEYEEKRLKKLKLYVKDQMEQLRRSNG